MSLIDQLKIHLTINFSPSHLEIINESRGHSVAPGSESHLKIILVSHQFKDLSRLQRHQLVNQSLSLFFTQGLHAASLVLKDPTEPLDIIASPPCLGGSKNHAH